jgi:hypothetical protein
MHGSVLGIAFEKLLRAAHEVNQKCAFSLKNRAVEARGPLLTQFSLATEATQQPWPIEEIL